MKTPRPILFFATLAATITSAPAESKHLSKETQANLSIKLELARAIERGNQWLATQQKAGGHWGDTDYPALTALPLHAALADPTRDSATPLPENLEKGFSFLVDSAKSDGGIYGKGLAVYNTALSMMALLQKQDPSIQKIITDARRFLTNQQSDFDERDKTDNAFDGGVGYGGTYAHSDLSNTHFALEALYYSKRLLDESGLHKDKSRELDWSAAIEFVQRCQNLTSTNDQEWASDDPTNKGGFVYFPGDSKAGEQKLDNGKVALRSYGSMSYAGLLSLIYAELDKDDQRIVAVLKWLRANYTLEENPGLGGQGLYYYYHSMAKALRILDMRTLQLKDGSEVDWRRDLAKKLFDTQQPDGFWVNNTGRWWENDPVLVTSYAVLTLAHIHEAME